jgi:ribonuclease HI
MTPSMSHPQRVVVYTDGGAEPNPGIGGWGAVVIGPDAGERCELSGGEESTTNNRMELTAAIRALEALAPGHEVDLHTDSSYLRLGITQWLPRWKRGGWRLRGGDPVKNDDLWRELEAAAARHRVRWHWVKGHSGHRHNERAHTLAAAEIARRRRSTPREARDPMPGAAGGPPSGGAGGEGGGRQAVPDAAPDVEVLLKLSCVRGRGAWAARLRRGGEESVLGGHASGVTANRLELLAAVEVLAALRERERVDWRGGSDYLREGASKWLDGWRRRGYRTSGGDPVKNADVWRVLEQALARHVIRFRPAAEEDGPELATLEREVKVRLGRLR